MQSPVARVKVEAVRVKLFWHAYQKRLYAYQPALHAFRLDLYAYDEERYRYKFFWQAYQKSCTRTGRTCMRTA